MKNAVNILFTLLLSIYAIAQDTIKYIDNEECGCSLTYVNGIQTTQNHERYGFKLDDGTQIVPNKYMFVDQFTNGYCQVWMDYGKAGLIDSTGKEIVPCIYEEVALPADGMILVWNNTRFGYYDTTGNLAIPCQFPYANNFNEGRAPVAIILDSVIASWGFINKKGDVVIKPQYQFAHPFSEGYAVVKQYNRYGIIDTTGKERLPIKYEKITGVHGGRMFAGFPDEIAMFDENFKPITPFIYSRIDHEGNGLYLIQRNGKYGFINRHGKEVIKCKYDDAGGFIDGLSWVKAKNKYGIINQRGKYLLPLKYDGNSNSFDMYEFHEGLALIGKDGKVGYINKKGDIAIPLIYDGGKRFSENIAPIKKGYFWGYIDHNGTPVIPNIFDDAGSFEYGRTQITLHGNLHYMNPNGECVKNCIGMPKTWKIKYPTQE